MGWWDCGSGYGPLKIMKKTVQMEYNYWSICLLLKQDFKSFFGIWKALQACSCLYGVQNNSKEVNNRWACTCT